MPMDDLFQALNMFKQGVNQLATSRVIQGATEQTQSIRASEASEADKRNQLTALSHQLVGQLGALGAPVSDIAQQAANVGPTAYANANAMNEGALMTGNKELGAMAKRQQAFEQDPEYKMQLMRAKMDPMNAWKAMQFKAAQDQHDQKHLESINKLVDTQTSRFGNVAKLQGVNNQIADARTLLDAGTIDKRSLRELAVKYDAMLSNGSSTISGADHLEPKTRAQYTAGIKEWLTNKPADISNDVKGFTDYYRGAFDRLEKVNKNIIGGVQENNIASSMRQIAKRNPELVKGFVEDKIGKTANIDPKSGKITFGQPTSAAAVAPVMKPVKVRDKRTGQLINALQDEHGNLFSADGM